MVVQRFERFLFILLLPALSLAAQETLDCRCQKPNATMLYIQGFVPATNEVYTSQNIVPAAQVACVEINSANPPANLLPDYCLNITFSNTECDPSEATWQLIQAILSSEEQNKIFFLGGGCSLATEPLAALSGRFYNVTQVSYGSSTPNLSDRTMFPRFFRTIPSEVQSNSARFALMMRYGWERVATLHETKNVFSLVVEDFHTTYDLLYSDDGATSDDATDEEEEEDENENLILRSFTDDPEIPLRQIKDKDIRIILGFFYEDKARVALCQAYHMELTTPNHLWMFPAWYQQDWWNMHVNESDVETKRCTPGQMREAVRYSILLDSYNASATNESEPIISGTTPEEFEGKYVEALKDFVANSSFSNAGDSNPHEYGSFTYDAVYAIALALNATSNDLSMNGLLSLQDFNYSNLHNISEMIQWHMNRSNFIGVSGQIAFDDTGSRIGINAIYQLRECLNGEEGVDGLCRVKLAVHSPGPNMDNYDFEYILEPLWKGGSPPKDRRTPKNKYLNQDLIYTYSVFITLAILVAIALLVFNTVTITCVRKPLILDSAPLINTVIICGCILMLGTCYLLGIDSNTPRADDEVFTDNANVDPKILQDRDDRYAAVCTARLWLMTIGFTLSFGALFAKTWQVYRVYTNPKLKKEPFRIWNFLIILAIFLTIDLLYLSLWTGVFPFERNVDQDEDDDNDIVNNFEECDCDNFGYLIGALYVYKGLLVVFGLFLAYESRNVKYTYINDSRFVSIAMYIVVIMVGIGGPLSLVLAVHHFIDPAYSLAVLMIIASCMSCLLILFIPKFIYMAKGMDTMLRENSREEVTVSDGLQLGRSTVDQSDIRTVEDEVSDLRMKVVEKDQELQDLEAGETGDSGRVDEEEEEEKKVSTEHHKPRSGSDGDSGVLVTGEDNENDIFNSESTGDARINGTTPTNDTPAGLESSDL